MRYSISGDDLMWLLRVAGSNGSPHTLKEILGDVEPIVEPVGPDAPSYGPATMVDTDGPGMWPHDAVTPPAKPE